MAKFDRSQIHEKCEHVRCDNNDVNWSAFVYEGSNIVHGASGAEYADLEEFLAANDDRVYVFVRVQMGDEMSIRMKFAFITYYGSSVSGIAKGKCSADKQAIKSAMPDVAQDFLMDGSLDWDDIKEGLKKAGGANYNAQA